MGADSLEQYRTSSQLMHQLLMGTQQQLVPVRLQLLVAFLRRQDLYVLVLFVAVTCSFLQLPKTPQLCQSLLRIEVHLDLHQSRILWSGHSQQNARPREMKMHHAIYVMHPITRTHARRTHIKAFQADMADASWFVQYDGLLNAVPDMKGGAFKTPSASL